MTNYKVNPNRDAWSVIRGFVYQVDMTLLRWLELKDDEYLELERGEDIDIIFENIRQLEQIKVRENNLTLRSPEANEALANFYDHLNNNKVYKLSFRFITNAEYGRESSPWRMKESALDIWEKIRTNLISESKLEEVIKEIREFLLIINRPQNLNKEIWDKWKEFVSSSTNADFLEFIKSFEWGGDNPGPGNIREKIEELIIDYGYTNNNSQSSRLYEKIFCLVFNKLSKKGLKQLR